MILDLIDCEDEVLHTEIPKFDFSGDVDPVKLSKDLAETMIHNKGLGLAANQCGLQHRVFVMNAAQIIACFNPIIVDSSEETVYLEEGCLSYPDYFVKVKRPKKIKVRYYEPNGEVVTKTFDGMTARIFQHELDHLNGISHMDRATKFHIEQAKKKLSKLRLKGKISTTALDKFYMKTYTE